MLKRSSAEKFLQETRHLISLKAPIYTFLACVSCPSGNRVIIEPLTIVKERAYEGKKASGYYGADQAMII